MARFFWTWNNVNPDPWFGFTFTNNFDLPLRGLTFTTTGGADGVVVVGTVVVTGGLVGVTELLGLLGPLVPMLLVARTVTV